MRYCSCDEWEKNLDRTTWKDLKTFKVCPYCGKELKDNTSENQQNTNEELLLG
jgi:hypothetical protein